MESLLDSDWCETHSDWYTVTQALNERFVGNVIPCSSPVSPRKPGSKVSHLDLLDLDRRSVLIQTCIVRTIDLVIRREKGLSQGRDHLLDMLQTILHPGSAAPKPYLHFLRQV